MRLACLERVAPPSVSLAVKRASGYTFPATRCGSQVVRQRIANPLHVGSSPIRTSEIDSADERDEGVVAGVAEVVEELARGDEGRERKERRVDCEA